MPTCDRCGAPAQLTVMSMFNTETICDRCKAEEVAHPLYEQARQAEHDAVMRGNHNFPGIGLPLELLPAPAERVTPWIPDEKHPLLD